MPQRTMPGASWGQTEAPPSYENALTPLEFEQKTASVVQQSLQEVRHHDSGPADNGKKRATGFEEFEDWDDAKFEAAAAAYRARQAKQQQNMSSSGGASSSTDRTQSPRGEPSSVSQQASGSGYEPSSSHNNAGQLPAHSKADSVSQRTLPLRPIDIYGESGVSPPQAPLPASEYPADVKDPRLWMEKQYEAQHGRPSLEGPPPFTSMASPTSMEESSAPQAEAIRGSRETLVASTTYGNVPPPPPIPRAQMTATPPAPTFHSPQRYSEIPLSTTTPHPYQPPQRRSDIPSPLHSNPRPQTIYRERPLGPERSTVSGEPYSRSRELYASAYSNVGGPTISIDVRKLPFHNQSSSLDSPEDSLMHTSFYSSSVSAYMTKRPLPQPKRTATTQSQYDGYVQPNSASTPSTTYSSPMYGGQPAYDNYNPPNGSMPPLSNQYGAPAVYPNHQQAQPYMNAYQSPLPQPAQQFQTPVFHQQAPGNQNYWPPQPGHWSSANYGRP